MRTKRVSEPTTTAATTRICAFLDCQTVFTPATGKQKYCSIRCGRIVALRNHRANAKACKTGQYKHCPICGSACKGKRCVMCYRESGEHVEYGRRGGLSHTRLTTLTEAISDGKTSPITKKTGFSIARGPSGFRAARLDKPLEPGEVALVRYEPRPAGGFVVVPPRIVELAHRGDSRWMTEWCEQQENEGRSGNAR